MHAYLQNIRAPISKLAFSFLVGHCLLQGVAARNTLAQELSQNLPQNSIVWLKAEDTKELVSKFLKSSAGQSVNHSTLNASLHRVFELILSPDAVIGLHGDLGKEFDAVNTSVSFLKGSSELGIWKTGGQTEFVVVMGIDSSHALTRAIKQSLMDARKVGSDAPKTNYSVQPSGTLEAVPVAFLGRTFWITSEKNRIFLGSSPEAIRRSQEPDSIDKSERRLTDSRSFQTIAEGSDFNGRSLSSARFYVDSRWLLESGFAPFSNLNPNAPPSVGVERDKTLETMAKAGLLDTAGLGGVFEFSNENDDSEWTLEAQIILTHPRKGLLAYPLLRDLEDIGVEISPSDVDLFYSVCFDLRSLQKLEDEAKASVNATNLNLQEMISLLPTPIAMFILAPAVREFSTGRVIVFGRSFRGSMSGTNNITAFEAQSDKGNDLVEALIKLSRPNDWEQVHDSMGEYWLESAARYQAKVERNRQINTELNIEMPRSAVGLLGNFMCRAISDVEFLHAYELWQQGTHSLKSSKEFLAAYREFQVASDKKAPVGFWYYARGHWLQRAYESAQTDLEMYRQFREASQSRRQNENATGQDLSQSDSRAQMTKLLVGDDKLPEFSSIQQNFGALIGGLFNDDTGFKLHVIQMRPLANENHGR